MQLCESENIFFVENKIKATMASKITFQGFLGGLILVVLFDAKTFCSH